MTSLRVVTAQTPEPPDTDDRVFVLDNAVVVLDGASAVDRRDVSTGMYVDTLGAELVRGLTATSASLTDVLASAIEATARRLALRRAGSPSSTVTIVRADRDGIDVLVLGDSQVVTPATTIRDDRLAHVATAERSAYRRRLAEGTGYDQRHRDLLRALQAEQARHRNTQGGFWIAEADPEAAAHSVTARIARDRAPWLALMTDGTYRPAEHLKRDAWASIAAKSSDGLQEFLQGLHAWESLTDPDGVLMPRAKRHDDKTLAVAYA